MGLIKGVVAWELFRKGVAVRKSDIGRARRVCSLGQVFLFTSLAFCSFPTLRKDIPFSRKDRRHVGRRRW